MGRKPEGYAENSFKRFGKKLDELVLDLKGIKNQAEDKYSDQILAELQRNKEKLVEELKTFKEEHKETIEDLEKGIDKRWERK